MMIQERTEPVAVKRVGESCLQQRGLVVMRVVGKGGEEAVKEVAESSFLG
jgi:hypothetical protein